jgi:hypothetical protein
MMLVARWARKVHALPSFLSQEWKGQNPNPASLAPTRGLLPLIAKKSGCIEADGDGGGYDAADQMVMAS